MSERTKIKEKRFLKKMNVKLVRKIMHQMNSLIYSFIPPLRGIETFHRAGYVRLQKKRQIQAKRKKFAQKIWHENDVPAH